MAAYSELNEKQHQKMVKPFDKNRPRSQKQIFPGGYNRAVSDL
jgi:hypothetical protein